MPRKVNLKKAHNKRFPNNRYKKHNRTKNSRMTIIRTTHHMPIAPRMKIAFEQTINGYFSSGSASGVAYLGLNTLASLTAGAVSNGPLLNNVSVLPNLITTTVASYPVGFGTYVDPANTGNSLYNQVICYGCRITITMTPQSVVDISEFSLVPIVSYSNGAGTVQIDKPYTSLAAASQGPYGKSLMVTSNNNIRQNTLTHYVDVAKFFGVTKKVLTTDELYIHLRGNTGSEDDEAVLNAPRHGIQWQINYQSADSTVLSTNLCYKIMIKYYCILQGPSTVGLSV